MKYCEATTNNHNISQTYLQCLKDINDLINENIDDKSDLCSFFENNEIVIDGDLAEKMVANFESRNVNNSVDMIFGISQKFKNKQIVFVELKLNCENSMKSIKAIRLIEKDMFSRTLFTTEIEQHQITYFIFSKSLLQQAKSVFQTRLFGKVPNSFIPITLEDLKEKFF